ncbi:MAG: hypothetical protein Q7T55_24605, partial [Solirubrobacteraceae bacterium]|nr:hypothetical protein [Solirubrobacteraceae bacterium]
RSLPALASSVVLGVCLFAAPSAQAIALDSTFGTGGTLFTPASETLADRYQAATNGPNNTTYHAGYVNVGATDRAFFVTKLKADGTLDTTFGTNGYAIHNLVSAFTTPPVGATPSGSAESAKGIAVQANGKIVVVGVAETIQDGTAADSRDQDLYVIRLNTDGSLDSDFGAAGVRRFSGSNGLPAPAVNPTPTPAVTPSTPTAPTITADQAWGISVRGNDKIVLTISKGTDSGDIDGRTDRDLGAVQLTADGAIDTTFGTNSSGAVYARTPYISEAARGNALDADGKVVVAGYGALGGTGGSNRPSLPRFTENGVLDTTFGGDSAGTTSGTQNPANFPVPGVPGVASSAFGGAVAEAYAIAKSGSGYAVGAYGRNTGTQNRGMMYRFDNDGHWDTTWGDSNGLTFFPGTAADAIRDFTAVSNGFVGAGSRGTDAALFVAKTDGT